MTDGNIVAAAQEERFTRVRHDAAIPVSAIAYCVSAAGLTLSDIDVAVFYEKPFVKFERLLETYVAFAPRGFTSFRAALPLWIKEKLFQRAILERAFSRLDPAAGRKPRLLFADHHQSHAASAFFASPFQEAAILTVDGVGEWATTTTGYGIGNQLSTDKELRYPHSLGLLYSAFTYYTGFRVNSGEYKVMGLAPYGRPVFAQRIYDHLIDLKEDGTFRLDQSYFDYCTGLTMTNDRFAALFGAPPRDPASQLTQRDMDLAASVQAVTNEVMLRLARHTAKATGSRNLCLAGGVALNCVANGLLRRDRSFDRIWIQPAAGDAGGALGAALAAYHLSAGLPRVVTGTDAMRGALLGPSFSQSECEQRLTAMGARFTVVDDRELAPRVCCAIMDGGAIGWFQGRMEFGPRALGARSILADARSPVMQRRLNLKTKGRESFRPFAPAVTREDAGAWFDIGEESPYMLLTADVLPSRRTPDHPGEEHLFGLDRLALPRSEIPAVTHVDYSARLQTVDGEVNPRFHELLVEFKRQTGCPVLINTSFNVRGEPIVCTPEDAFRCFMSTDLDMLVIERCVLLKGAQDPKVLGNYKHAFTPD